MKNIEVLKDKIVEEIIGKGIDTNALVLTNERQLNILNKCDEWMQKILNAKDLSVDVIAMLVKNLWNELGKITGNTENEDIITLIFSKFCLGK